MGGYGKGGEGLAVGSRDVNLVCTVHTTVILDGERGAECEGLGGWSRIDGASLIR